MHKRIRNVLCKFKQTGTTNLENAFNAASFLANKAWMQHVAMSGHDLHVSYGTGKDTEVPTISLAGIVVVSAIYLGSLIALGIYATYPPRWTDQLDSFAMMRIGSALAPDVPPAASDATRGWLCERLLGWWLSCEGDIDLSRARPRKPAVKNGIFSLYYLLSSSKCSSHTALDASFANGPNLREISCGLHSFE